MAPKKKEKTENMREKNLNATIIGSGLVVEQPVAETLEVNYMPYAMSVIVSRAIPEIDGFKPAHRKLLYMMYDMGLLKGSFVKCANIVGQTMKLNPHGDAAIYDTLVRLSRGNETLLHPYIESKGSFGKAYSRDMVPAAYRYTEACLAKISSELFADISKDTVDFVDNYDASMKEPTLLPVTFPSVLVNANTGIAVGMASSICSFNLTEVCETTIRFLRDPDFDIIETLPAPDFPGGGTVMYDREEMKKIFETGRGGFKVRGRYTYDKSYNCIDITEIPPTTNCESIIEKVIELVKLKKVTEINDIRDETGRDGMKITIDLKRGADPDKLMQKLYKLTPLEDTFSCNFNILIAGTPRVLGVRQILEEWVAFRSQCVKRRVYFDLKKAKDKLHLLKGLSKILLDIDKAVKIVRETEAESEVVPNLMIGFGIDEIQANYVAEIKLRHLNKEYILNRLSEIDGLEESIRDMEDLLSKSSRIKSVIISELKEVIKKYGQPRKTEIVFKTEENDAEYEEKIPDYPVTLFFTKEGYFKKITPQSLRMSGEQKLKDGDEIVETAETTNDVELMFFTNKCQVYKTRAAAFADSKASLLGDYVASKLEMEEGETAIYMAVVPEYKGSMLFFYENGKVSKIDLAAYETKTNRKKLINAHSDKSPLTAVFMAAEDGEYLLHSSNGRMLLFNSAAINVKTTKNTQGVAVMTQRKGHRLMKVEPYVEGSLLSPHRYRTKTLPSAGSIMKAEEKGEQMSLI